MLKILLVIILFLLFSPAIAAKVFAYSNISEQSADFRKVPVNTISNHKNLRILQLTEFLRRYNSLLVTHSEFIINMADEYQIPWTLLVAIAGVESTFCKHIPRNSYNCWGWNNGKYYFKDFAEGITIVSAGLKAKYFIRGLTTPERIGPYFAPPTPSWSKKVRHFMNQIDKIIPTPIINSKFSI